MESSQSITLSTINQKGLTLKSHYGQLKIMKMKLLQTVKNASF